MLRLVFVSFCILRLAASVRVPTRRRLAPQETIIGGGVDCGYIAADVQIGTPGKPFSVILDTGSSKTIVPCAGCHDCGHERVYHPTLSRSSEMRSPFAVSYLEGSSLRGQSYLDRIVVDGTDSRMLIGCATVMTRMFREQEAEGICGLNGDAESLVQVLRAQHLLERNTFGLRLCDDTHFSVGEAGVGPWLGMEHVSGNYHVGVRGVGMAGGGGGAFTPLASDWVVDSGSTFIYMRDPERSWLSSALPPPTMRSRVWSDVGCYASTVAMPTVEVFTLDGSLTLRPEQYLYDGPGNDGLRCVGVFDAGRGRNTLGLIGLEGRHTHFDLGSSRISFEEC
jgi:hypothetical protein